MAPLRHAGQYALQRPARILSLGSHRSIIRPPIQPSVHQRPLPLLSSPNCYAAPLLILTNLPRSTPYSHTRRVPHQHTCSRGPGFCEAYQGKLSGTALKGLLERTVPPTADDYYQTDPEQSRHEPWWLLHEHSSQFMSREVQSWLHNNAITCLEWPSLSGNHR
jgi:hypothetical protein